MKGKGVLFFLFGTLLFSSCVSARQYPQDIDWTMVPNSYNRKQDGISYGTVEKNTYYSTVTECNRQCNVLLPQGYSPNKKYPVLYLLHGINGDEDQWLTGTSGQEVIGNAIASGAAVPMIIVFPNVRAARNNWEPQTDLDYFSDLNFRGFDNFINDLRDCLMPYIESHYPVLTGRKNTAIAGLSLGGREALYIGVKMQSSFCAVGAFSPAQGVVPMLFFPKNYVLLKAKQFVFSKEYQPSPLLISVGTDDHIVYDAPLDYAKTLSKNKMPHLFYYVPGEHDRVVWENNLYQFIIRLFK